MNDTDADRNTVLIFKVRSVCFVKKVKILKNDNPDSETNFLNWWFLIRTGKKKQFENGWFYWDFKGFEENKGTGGYWKGRTGTNFLNVRFENLETVSE